MARLEPEHLRSRTEAETELGDDRGSAQPTSTRSGRDQIAESVGHIQMAGVAPVRSRDRGGRFSDAGATAGPAGGARQGSTAVGTPRAVRGVGLAKRCRRRVTFGVRYRWAPGARRRGPSRTPGHRTRRRGLRGRASRTPRRYGQTPLQRSSRPGQRNREGRVAGASPAPGPTGRSCKPCDRDSRTSPASPRGLASPPCRRRSAARGGGCRSCP